MTEKSHKKPFEPMLASPRAEHRFPCIVQVKYDGIRCVVKNGVALTRKLEPIPNWFISATLSNPLFNGLDGELIAGPPSHKDVYHNTESVVMSENVDPSSVRFYVFDDFTDPRLPYHERFAQARRRIAEHSHIMSAAISATATDEEGLSSCENEAHEDGYEGLIVRDPYAMYKFGRATENEGSLYKIKRFEDDEMLVIRVEEWMHNANEDVRSNTGKAKRGHSKAGMVPTGLYGKLVGVSPKWPGKEITVGSSNLPRLSKKDAEEAFLNKLVVFKHQPAGAKDLPRFPVYKGIRHPNDLS